MSERNPRGFRLLKFGSQSPNTDLELNYVIRVVKCVWKLRPDVIRLALRYIEMSARDMHLPKRFEVS